MRDLIPWGRSRSPSLRESDERLVSPFVTLRREMDRLFDEAFAGFGPLAEWSGPKALGWPNIEMSEGDKEIRVSAELPGLDDNDIEINLADGVLSVRGEKRSDYEDQDRHYSERFFGRFERRIALPAEVDEDRIKATFKNGVLDVRLPKTERARQNTRRIPLST